MKALLAIIKKEFYHIFRDKRTLLVLFGMPLAQLILFGYAITTEIKHAPAGIWDKSKSPASRQLIQKLTATDFFTCSYVIHSEDDLMHAFRKGAVKIAIVIPPGFEQDLYRKGTAIQLITDGSDPNTASILSQSAGEIIQRWAKSQAPPLPYPVITPTVKWMYNPGLKSAFMFVPGVITIILMLVSAMLTSIAITREKELGNMEVLLVSPVKPAWLVIGKVVPYLLLSFLNAMMILLVSYFIFHLWVKGSMLLLMGEILLFICTALSLGILISTIAQSQQQALMMSLFMLMLPTILLSGFIFPISSMPWPLQLLSHWIPARWFLEIIRGIMLKGIGMEVLWKQTLILLFMVVALIGISARKFKIRLS